MLKSFVAAIAVALLLYGGALPVHEGPAHPGMVLVPKGPFWMGRSEEDAARARSEYGGDADLYTSSVPRRSLVLPAFWIDLTVVTNAAYAAFVAATGHRAPRADAVWAAAYNWIDDHPPVEQADHPVTLVGFEDARAYCLWLGKHLPTEEQWEKAARGPRGRRYPWGDRYEPSRVAGADHHAEAPLDHIEKWTAWWREVYRGRLRGTVVGTFPVGRFPKGASPYGALDMAGNVFEWVDAFFDPYPGATHGHPEFGLRFRVVRGGDWYLDRIYHEGAARLRAPADHRVPTIGFRCACDPDHDPRPSPR